VGFTEQESSIYEEVMLLKSSKGARLQRERANKELDVQSKKQKLIAQTMSVTLGSGGVLFNQSTKLRIPFNIIQKTKQQRLEIVKNVLGPPVGVTRNQLTMLKNDVAESDNLVVLQLNEVLDIQGILNSFLEVLENGLEVSLKTFVKQLIGIPSVFAIVAIMKDQCHRSQTASRCKEEASRFVSEICICSQLISEGFVGEKSLWDTVNQGVSIVSSFSCVEKFDLKDGVVALRQELHQERRDIVLNMYSKHGELPSELQMRLQPSTQLIKGLGISKTIVVSTYSDSIDKFMECMESGASVEQAIRSVNAEFAKNRRDCVLQEEPTMILNGLNCHVEEFEALSALFEDVTIFINLTETKLKGNPTANKSKDIQVIDLEDFDVKQKQSTYRETEGDGKESDESEESGESESDESERKQDDNSWNDDESEDDEPIDMTKISSPANINSSAKPSQPSDIIAHKEDVDQLLQGVTFGNESEFNFKDTDDNATPAPTPAPSPLPTPAPSPSQSPSPSPASAPSPPPPARLRKRKVIASPPETTSDCPEPVPPVTKKHHTRGSDEHKSFIKDITDQEIDETLYKVFLKQTAVNHKCDPFRNRLTRDLVDVREKINPENVEENYLSEEVINTFIRIVISQANSCHSGEKMFTHFSSQTLGQFELHGVAGLYGNGKNEKSKGIIIDRPAQDYRVVFCPTLVNTNHWVLIVVYPKRQLIHCFDSQNTAQKTLPAKYKRLISVVMGLECKTVGLKCAKQPDNISCGVFVCMHVLGLSYGLREDCWPSLKTSRALITKTVATGFLDIPKKPKKFHYYVRDMTSKHLDEIKMNE